MNDRNRKRPHGDLKTDTRALLVLLGCQAAIALIVYWRYITGAYAFIFKDIGSDTYNMFYPFMVHIGRYIREYGLPTWSFSQGLGQNIFPAGLSNPFLAILYLTGPDSAAQGIAFVELLKVFAGGIIFFAWLRYTGRSRFSAVAGGLAFSFCGYMIVGGTWYGHAAALVFGALYLFAFELLRVRKTPFLFPVAVFLLAGHSAFYLFQFSLFLALYAAVRHLADQGFKNPGALGILYVRMALFGSLGILIASFFILSDLQRMLDSPRVAGEAGSFADLRAANPFAIASAPQRITALMRLYSSDMLGSGSGFRGWYNYLEAPLFYSGLATLVALPQAFVGFCRKKRFAFGVWLLFLALAVVFPYLRHALYLFSGDYYKGGMSFIIPATLIPLGASGIQRAQEGKLGNKTLIATAAALLALLYAPYGAFGNLCIDANVRNLAATFIALHGLSLFLLDRRPTVFAQCAFLGVVCIELAMMSHLSTNKRAAVSLEELTSRTGYNDETVEAVAFLHSRDSSWYRISKDYTSGFADHASFNDAQAQGYYGTPSYSSFNQRYYIRFLHEMEVIDGSDETQTRWARGLEDQPLLQAFASVKYFLSRNSDSLLLGLGFQPLARFGEVSVMKNPAALPMGFACSRYITRGRFEALPPLAKQSTLFECFVAEDDDARAFTGLTEVSGHWRPPELAALPALARRARESSARLGFHSPKRLAVTRLSRGRELLFFSIPYDKGWRATVDGVPARLHLVNIGFMGLTLSPGLHEIELRYVPPFFYSSALLSALGIVVFSVLALRSRRNSR